VPVPVPLTSNGLLLALETTLRGLEGPVKMAVLDHISSKPAYVLPIVEMVGCVEFHGGSFIGDSTPGRCVCAKRLG
jgi:hypothetical protein